jgi:hypothetical protein
MMQTVAERIECLNTKASSKSEYGIVYYPDPKLKNRLG